MPDFVGCVNRALDDEMSSFLDSLGLDLSPYVVDGRLNALGNFILLVVSCEFYSSFLKSLYFKSY